MKRKTNVRYLSELALLTALVLIMAYTPLGYLKTPWGVEITFIVIPVAVGSIILGPMAGGFLGLVFGLTSFFQCFGASPLGAMLLQVNALGTFFCCVVNRVLVGVIPGLLYLLLKKFDRTRVVGIALCCFLTPVLNTVLYIAGNWAIFAEDHSTTGCGLKILGVPHPETAYLHNADLVHTSSTSLRLMVFCSALHTAVPSTRQAAASARPLTATRPIIKASRLKPPSPLYP